MTRSFITMRARVCTGRSVLGSERLISRGEVRHRPVFGRLVVAQWGVQSRLWTSLSHASGDRSFPCANWKVRRRPYGRTDIPFSYPFHSYARSTVL